MSAPNRDVDVTGVADDAWDSYFGKQEGDFSVELKAIRARKQTTEEKDAEVVQPSQKPISNEESENNQQNGGQQSSGMIAWLSRMCKLS